MLGLNLLRRRSNRGFAEAWKARRFTHAHEASEVLKPVYECLPVILDPADYGTWLDPQQ